MRRDNDRPLTPEPGCGHPPSPWQVRRWHCSIGAVQISATNRDGLADEITELVLARAGRVRVAIDGPPPTTPLRLADHVAILLRERGRAVVVVDAGDFLRPASVRLERGREDPDEFLHGWLDVGGLRREVLDPASQSGAGRVLPRLWNAAADRAFRDDYDELPPDGA